MAVDLNLNTNSAQQFDDTPVASKQGSVSSNIDPIKVPKATTPQQSSGTKVMSMTQNLPENQQGINIYQYDRSDEAMSGRRGSDTQGGVANNMITNHYGQKYFTDKIWGIDLGVNNNETSNPYWNGIDPESEGVDFEHLRRNSQSTGVATANLFNQFIGKTVVNTVGGIVGGFYSLGSAAVNWDSSKLYDNSVNRALDSATEWVDENNNVNTSERAREQQDIFNVFNVEGAKNLSDGFSFVAGAVLSEVVMAWATGGIANGFSAASKTAGIGGKIANRMSKIPGKINSLPSKAIASLGTKLPLGNAMKTYGETIKRAIQLSDEIGDAAKGIRTAEDVAKLEKLIPGGLTNGMEDLNKLAQINKATSSLVTGGRRLVTGSFWESGLEARQSQDEFFEKNMEKARQEVSEMDIDDIEKEKFLKEKEARIKNLSQSVGVSTFLLNAGVLAVSNKIQFPTIFGTPSRIRPSTLKNTYKKTLDKLTGKESWGIRGNVGKFKKAGNILKILKNPLSEGLEEMLQSGISTGTSSYYDDVLNAKTNMDYLYGDMSDFWSDNEASILRSGVDAFTDTFTNTESYKEGVIGAIMGLTGIPMFKRNNKGKLKPYMTGGIWKDIKDIKNENTLIKDGIQTLDSQGDSITNIIGYNKQRSVIDKKAAEKKDLAVVAGEMQSVEDAQFDDIHKIAFDMNQKGLRSYITEEFDTIDNLTFEQYKEKFSYDDTFTKEEWNADKRRVKEAFDRSNKAYDSVYKTLGMDALNDDDTSNNMVNILTHAMAYDDYAVNKIQVLKDKILRSKSLDTLLEKGIKFDDLVKTTSEYQRELAMYKSSLNRIVKGDLEANKIEVGNLIAERNDIGTGIPETLKAHLSDLNEAVKKGDNEAIKAIQEVIDTEIQSNPNEVTKSDIIDRINRFKEIQKQLTEKHKPFESIEELEQAAFEIDGLAQIRAKKSIKYVQAEINKKLKLEHREAKKGLLSARNTEAKQLKSSELLKIVEANNKLKELIANSNQESFERSFIESLDPNSELLDMEDSVQRLTVLYQKQATALELLNEVHKIGAGNSYINFKVKEFDSGMMSLKIKILMLNESDINSDDYLVDVTSLKEIYDIQITRKQELIDNKYIKAEVFEDVDKTLDSAKKLIDTFGDYIAEKAEIENINKSIDKAEQDKIRDKELTDAAKSDKGTELVLTPNKVNKVGEGNNTDEVILGKGQQIEPLKKDGIQATNKDNTKPSTLLDKSTMFTLNPSKTTMMKDIHSTDDKPKTLRDVIDDGTIKYNSSAVVQLADEDPVMVEDPEFIKAVLDNNPEFIEKYKNGLEEILADPGILDLDYSNLSENVKFYISKARITMSFYGKKVRVDAKKQFVNIKDEDVPTITIYTPSPTLNYTSDERQLIHDKYNNKINQIKAKYELDKQKLIGEEGKYSLLLDENGEIVTSLPSSPEANKLEIDYQIQLNNIEMQRDKEVLETNDLANFAMRLTAIKQSLLDNKKGVQMRVGNFINGSFTESTDNTNEYGLMDEINPLFGPQFNDEFSFDKLGFGNSNGLLIDFKSGKTIPLREGSVVEGMRLSTNKIYTYITTPNGQKLTIKLNTSKLSDHPIIMEEILHQVKEMYKLEGKSRATEKIKLSSKGSKTLSFAKNMTYQEFFESLLNSWKGTSSSTSDLGGFFNVTPEGIVRAGTLEVNGEINQEVEDAIKVVLSNARLYINKKTLYNKGVLNKAYGDFLLDNKILSHNMETSKNNRRFLPEAETLKMQLHVLNDTSDDLLLPKAKVKSNYEGKIDYILKELLGLKRREGDKGTLKNINNSLINEQIIRQLATRFTKNLNDENNKELSQEQLFDKTLNDYFKEKQVVIKEVFIKYPDLITDKLFKLSDVEKYDDIKIKKEDTLNGNVLENYMYGLVSLIQVYNSKKGIMVSAFKSYSGNITIVDDFKNKLISEEYNKINTGTVENITVTNNKGSYNVLSITPSTNENTMNNVELEFKEAKSEYIRLSENKGSKIEIVQKAKERYEKALEAKKEHTKAVIGTFFKVGNLVDAMYETGNASKTGSIDYGKSKFFINYTLNWSYIGKDKDGKPVRKLGNKVISNTIHGDKTNQDTYDATLMKTSNRKPFYLKYKDNGVWKETSDPGMIDMFIDRNTGELKGAVLLMTTTSKNTGETNDVIVMGDNKDLKFSAFQAATSLQLYGLDSKMNIVPEKIEELDRLLGIFASNKKSLPNIIEITDKDLNKKVKDKLFTKEGFGVIKESTEADTIEEKVEKESKVEGIFTRAVSIPSYKKTRVETIEIKGKQITSTGVPKVKISKEALESGEDFSELLGEEEDFDSFSEDIDSIETDGDIETFEEENDDIPDISKTSVEENFSDVTDHDIEKTISESNKEGITELIKEANLMISSEDRYKSKLRDAVKLLTDNDTLLKNKDHLISYIKTIISKFENDERQTVIDTLVETAIDNDIVKELTKEDINKCKV